MIPALNNLTFHGKKKKNRNTFALKEGNYCHKRSNNQNMKVIRGNNYLAGKREEESAMDMTSSPGP